MKLKKMRVLMLICLIVAVSSMSFANSFEDSSKSGMVNVDELISEYSKTAVQGNKLYSSSEDTSLNSVQRESAGGGTFWVEWNLILNGADAFGAYYDHPEEFHRSTAANAYDSVRSGVTSPGYTAEAVINTTLTGNKAYWYVY